MQIHNSVYVDKKKNLNKSVLDLLIIVICILILTFYTYSLHLYIFIRECLQIFIIIINA